MKKYIGLKIIKAKPMTECEFLQHVKGENVINREDRRGYLVEYKDGYKSWSPKETFEDAYRPLEELDFKEG